MVRIISDTLSSIPVEEAKQFKLPLLPQIVIFEEESYKDDSEIDSETFIERLKRSSVLPKTAAPYPHLYQPILEQLVKTGDEILSFKLSPFWASKTVKLKHLNPKGHAKKH